VRPTLNSEFDKRNSLDDTKKNHRFRTTIENSNLRESFGQIGIHLRASGALSSRYDYHPVLMWDKRDFDKIRILAFRNKSRLFAAGVFGGWFT